MLSPQPPALYAKPPGGKDSEDRDSDRSRLVTQAGDPAQPTAPTCQPQQRWGQDGDLPPWLARFRRGPRSVRNLQDPAGSWGASRRRWWSGRPVPVPTLSVRRFQPAPPPPGPWAAGVLCGSVWAPGTGQLCLTWAHWPAGVGHPHLTLTRPASDGTARAEAWGRRGLHVDPDAGPVPAMRTGRQDSYQEGHNPRYAWLGPLHPSHLL